MQVRRRLDVDGDAVGAGLGELGHVALGALDHQVHVDDPPGLVDQLGDRADDHGPKVIGGTKCPSITSTWITRAPAASTSATCAPRRAKSADRIDGATRRWRSSSARATATQTACSMLPWQWLQATIAVVDIRTIVECSPQLGHTDTSS